VEADLFEDAQRRHRGFARLADLGLHFLRKQSGVDRVARKSSLRGRCRPRSVNAAASICKCASSKTGAYIMSFTTIPY
jgi:hypothetical protein